MQYVRPTLRPWLGGNVVQDVFPRVSHFFGCQMSNWVHSRMVLEQYLRLIHNPHDKTIMRKLLSTFLLLASLPLVASNGWTLPARATAVVTGGTKGIGRAIVEELAGVHKCRVLTCARNPDELKEFVAQCHAKGMDVEGVVADVATIEGRTTLITKIEAFVDGQGLDILVNNVGTNIRKPSIEYTQDEIEFLLNTNLCSMFGLTTGCHKFLKRLDGTTSSVVNIGSVAGVTCVKTGTPYSATKSAMNHVTGNWACEWGPDGIRVNCVTPW
jgi:Tropinone reductase 1